MKLSDLSPGDVIVRSRPSTGRSRHDMLEDCGVVLGRAQPYVESSTATSKQHNRVRVELPSDTPARLGLRPGNYPVSLVAGRSSLERSPTQTIVAWTEGPRRAPRPDRLTLQALATGHHVRLWSEDEAARMSARWAVRLAQLGDRRENIPMLVFNRTDWNLGPYPRPEALSRIPLPSDLRFGGHVRLAKEDRSQTAAGRVSITDGSMAAIVDADLVIPDPGGALLEQVNAAATVAEVGPSLDRVASGLRRLVTPADTVGSSRRSDPSRLVEVDESKVTLPWQVLERLLTGDHHEVVGELLDVSAHLAELRTQRAELAAGDAAAPPTDPM